MGKWSISKEAARLHADALVWDDHSGFEPRPDAELGHLKRWIDAGVNYLSVDVGYDVITWQDTIKNIAAFRSWFEKRAHDFVLVDTADDILRAKREGKLAIAFDIEGMNALDGDPNMVSLYYGLGVRQMLFAYNLNNEAGGGCHDEDTGLTPFGRRAIAEMNRVGMLVDCSHTGYQTTMEAMEVSTAPVIFSHSNPIALNKHGRNVTDEQIKGCARTGGVIGLNGIGLFLGDPAVRTETFANAIDYVVQLVGAEHVGIGLDYAFDHGSLGDLLTLNTRYWPRSEGYGEGDFAGVEPEQLPELTEALLGKGYGEADVAGVLGQNFLRVARQVWT